MSKLNKESSDYNKLKKIEELLGCFIKLTAPILESNRGRLPNDPARVEELILLAHEINAIAANVEIKLNNKLIDAGLLKDSSRSSD